MSSLFFPLVFSNVVMAFTLNSSNDSNFRGWASPNINLVINTSNCPSSVDVTTVISQSIAVWNNLATSNLKLTIAGTTTSTTASNPVTVYCEINYGSVVGDANSSPGAASVLPTSGDYITSGVIYLNASTGSANIANYSSTVLALVLAHEIGHLVGLGHSQDQTALMYYNASGKSTLSLAQDDIDGVSYLYPRSELGSDKPLGCALMKEPREPLSPWRKMELCLGLLLPLFIAILSRVRYLKTKALNL